MRNIAQILENLPPERQERIKRRYSDLREDVGRIDKVARAICLARCASIGLSPCWSEYTERDDAQEWPNLECQRPGCHALAREAVEALRE